MTMEDMDMSGFRKGATYQEIKVPQCLPEKEEAICFFQIVKIIIPIDIVKVIKWN